MTEKLTYIASAITVILGVLNAYAAAFGVLIALATFGINVWFKVQEYLILKGKKYGNN